MLHSRAEFTTLESAMVYHAAAYAAALREGAERFEQRATKMALRPLIPDSVLDDLLRSRLKSEGFDERDIDTRTSKQIASMLKDTHRHETLSDDIWIITRSRGFLVVTSDGPSLVRIDPSRAFASNGGIDILVANIHQISDAEKATLKHLLSSSARNVPLSEAAWRVVDPYLPPTRVPARIGYSLLAAAAFTGLGLLAFGPRTSNVTPERSPNSGMAGRREAPRDTPPNFLSPLGETPLTAVLGQSPLHQRVIEHVRQGGHSGVRDAVNSKFAGRKLVDEFEFALVAYQASVGEYERNGSPRDSARLKEIIREELRRGLIVSPAGIALIHSVGMMREVKALMVVCVAPRPDRVIEMPKIDLTPGTFDYFLSETERPNQIGQLERISSGEIVRVAVIWQNPPVVGK